jgi:hypothetical protein
MDEPITDTSAITDTGADTTAQPDTSADTSAAPQPNEPNTNPDASTEPSTTDDNSSWLQSKGIDPQSPEAIVKLAEMARNAEKRMHESTAQASELKKALESGDNAEVAQALDVPEEMLQNPVFQQLVDKINQLEAGQTTIATANKVNDFFAQNPDARNYESAMTAIVTDNPTIGTLVKGGYLGFDQLYAMAKGSDANRDDTLKNTGGKEALERIADKQQGRAVSGKATSSQLTPPSKDEFREAFHSLK